ECRIVEESAIVLLAAPECPDRLVQQPRHADEQPAQDRREPESLAPTRVPRRQRGFALPTRRDDHWIASHAVIGEYRVAAGERRDGLDHAGIRSFQDAAEDLARIDLATFEGGVDRSRYPQEKRPRVRHDGDP